MTSMVEAIGAPPRSLWIPFASIECPPPSFWSLSCKRPYLPLPSEYDPDLDQRPGSAWEFATAHDGPRQWLMQEYESSALLPSGVTDFAEYFTLQNSPGILMSLALLKSCPQLASWSSLSCPLTPLLASPGSTSLTNHWPRNPHLRTWFWGSWSKTTSGTGVIQVLEL